MKSAARFIGFSTRNRIEPPFRLEGIELVKNDLLNEFETRLGERVMQPEYGTIIYDILMEPLDDISRQQLVEDVERIVNRDPRTQFNDLRMTETEHTIQIEVILTYVPLRIQETLLMEYQTDIENQYE